ncbi:MAG: hypothetical protein IPK19_27840 [Chloroflexi bacterium]|nr:hypothetical protein [Chloroflexota bacterium]
MVSLSADDGGEAGIVARRLQIQYRLPATFGEEIAISTYLSETRRSTTVRHYSITRADNALLLAQARGCSCL